MISYSKRFAKYVSQSILGMLGVSAYVIVDTFFISIAAGVNGLTALNLALPVYGLIFGLGELIGVGSATRYSILKAQGDDAADYYFSNGLMWGLIVSIPFILLGIFCPQIVVQIMGGSPEIIALGSPYFRLFLLFAPFFICNYQISCYLRNDGDPTLAMVACISGCASNVIFDYIFMFPMGMGMAGAALATVMSPIFNMAICSIHFLKKKNTIRFVWQRPNFKRLMHACSLGVSAMIAELASAVTTTVFNFLLLYLVGDIAVAAYGVIANISIVFYAIINGIAQGSQPLISQSYGINDSAAVKKYLRLALITAEVFSVIAFIGCFILTDPLIALFNSENNLLMKDYAHLGMRLYFIGFLVASINMILVGYYSASDQPKKAFITSILRGIIAISICAIAMGLVLGIIGVWLSFAVAEVITLIFTLFIIRKR